VRKETCASGLSGGTEYGVCKGVTLIVEVLIGSVTSVVLASFWLSDRILRRLDGIDPKKTARRLASIQKRREILERERELWEKSFETGDRSEGEDSKAKRRGTAWANLTKLDKELIELAKEEAKS